MYQFKFDCVSEDDVHKYLSSLSDDSNIDILGFDSKLLRCGADVLTASLTELFNVSIRTHCLPADWKRARVTPVYKGTGSMDDPSSFRPISIVSHIPKILERCINSQLSSYFDEHDLLSCDQSAFRKGHSTATAAHKLVDDLLDNINEGLINGSCFFDLKKCFDTIDHDLLLQKLEKYGIIGPELLWFKSYLTNRTQCVASNGTVSSFKHVTTGVPQGSVLGPLLFLIFINDLPDALYRTASNIYADDTEIHACGSSMDEVNDILQCGVDDVSNWFYENKLVLNNTKSFCMLTTSNRCVSSTDIHVSIEGVKVEQVECTRYLGIHPDRMLSWAIHIEKLCNKIAPKVGLLRRLKHIVPNECLRAIYVATVQSHIDYCLTVWGYAPDIYLNKVQSLQNRAARIITGNYDRNIRGIQLVRDLGWLNLRQRRDYFVGIMVFKSLNGNSPDHIADLFTFTRDLNVCNTRSTSSNDLFVPRINKHVFTQALQVTGPKMWNSIPTTIRSSTSLDMFKFKLKRHLLSEA